MAIIVILLIIYRDIIDTVLGLLGLVLAIVWMYGFGAAMGSRSTP